MTLNSKDTSEFHRRKGQKEILVGSMLIDGNSNQPLERSHYTQARRVIAEIKEQNPVRVCRYTQKHRFPSLSK